MCFYLYFYPMAQIDPYKQQIAHLKDFQRNQMANRKQKCLILGMGPGGLAHALTAIMHGHHAEIVEKRAEGGDGRPNTINLNEKTIAILKKTAVYQYLKENKLILPAAKAHDVDVRLQDLEKALKAVILELAPDTKFHYSSKVTQIATEALKASVTLESAGGTKCLGNLDVIVNAEGSRSSTNELLNIGRREVIPKVPVIAAIFKDTRPKIRGCRTFFRYIGLTLKNKAVSVYYYAILIFKMIFQREHFFTPHRQIAGALILKTPSQHYLGYGFTKKRSDELLALKKGVEEKRHLLENAKKQGFSKDKIKKMEQDFQKADKKYRSFMTHWTQLSFCAANVVALLAKWRGAKIFYKNAHCLPLTRYQVVEIGADRADKLCQRMNGTAFLVTGDAAATVDPTTGLGGNTAIQSSELFAKFLKVDDLDRGLIQYRCDLDHRIRSNHASSAFMRHGYRPDTVAHLFDKEPGKLILKEL